LQRPGVRVGIYNEGRILLTLERNPIDTYLASKAAAAVVMQASR